MRKVVIASLLGSLLVLTSAAPALAHRDPFDPVISQADLTGATDAAGSADGAGTDDDGAGTGTAPGDVVAGVSSEALADTGAESEPWLVAAFVLIAIGAGAVVLSKVNAQPA